MSEKQADALILEMVECVGQMATLDIAAWMLKEMELDPSGLSGVRQQVEARAMSVTDAMRTRLTTPTAAPAEATGEEGEGE
jgi:hypothetical protein